MIITKTCNTCEHYPNDEHCVGCEWDKANGINTKWELMKNPIVIERKMLEQLRAEIKTLVTEGQNDYQLGFNGAVFRVLQIIDKHTK